MLGTVALLLGLVVVLPPIAAAAQAAVPALFSILMFLAIARLLWPRRRRR